MRVSVAALLVLATSTVVTCQENPRDRLRNAVLSSIHEATTKESRSLARRSTPLSWTLALGQTVQLNLGTPPQTFESLVDTGSPDTFVLGDQCMSFACLTGQQFNAPRSSTFRPTTAAVQLHYADDTNVTGIAAQDVLTLDGQTLSNFTFAYIQHYEQENTVVATHSALLGMSFPLKGLMPGSPSIKPLGSSTVQQLLGSNITRFSFLPSFSGARKGRLTLNNTDFGTDVNTSAGTQWINLTAPVDTVYEAFWAPKCKSITIAGATSPAQPLNDLPILLDTGTTFTILPGPIVTYLGTTLGGELAKFPSAEAPIVYKIACAKAATMPNVVLELNGVKVSVPATAYVQNSFFSDGCIIGFVGTQGALGGSMGLVGMNVLRAFYTTWDFSARSVGFTPLADVPVPKGTIIESAASTYTSSSFASIASIAVASALVMAW
ncbi:aspartic peptidase domain-containing protein [Fimicolochytrium jonesii]|uniref:aspartic peptidase domain-containing protein n=1 Tax=Fimicolochytrium jonesii TaxID=1396493 RepID=UPI0022FF27EB|nr:aspartic peptidase domain-containing protein [Fimicolochytrium jonesii]KAI8820827.1 aspartic peptidase domain-containing protein [Fimicolochytrium jonesii]